jgi:hypothetical protein
MPPSALWSGQMGTQQQPQAQQAQPQQQQQQAQQQSGGGQPRPPYMQGGLQVPQPGAPGLAGLQSLQGQGNLSSLASLLGPFLPSGAGAAAPQPPPPQHLPEAARSGSQPGALPGQRFPDARCAGYGV